MRSIRTLRLERRETIKELAAALGISATTLSRYEHGKFEPSLDVIVKMADHFGVSVDYMLGRTGNQFSEGCRLSERQKKLIMSFNMLMPLLKDSVLELVENLSKGLI